MGKLIVPLVLLSVLSAGCLESAPEVRRDYRYRCDLLNYDAHGKFQNKMRIGAILSCDVPEKTVRWSEPTLAFGKALEGDFGQPLKQTYMEGFTYPVPQIQDLLKPEFYKGFPATPLGFLMRNSIVDAHMFDVFVAELDRMTLNRPYRSAASDADIDLGGQGNQKLKNLTLTWIGDLPRNGRSCAVILYQSSLDSVEVSIPGATFAGSTIFWGEIWVCRCTKAVEYATLREHALMGSPKPEAKITELQNTNRTVIFERIIEDPDRPARPSGESDRPDQPDQPDKTDQPEKPDQPEKTDPPDQPEKPDSPDPADAGD
ncbi:MAG: hypothetical protein ACYTHM_22240 [Planctomycetota bacterium]|jgi:hypothetical protein